LFTLINELTVVAAKAQTTATARLHVSAGVAEGILACTTNLKMLGTDVLLARVALFRSQALYTNSFVTQKS